MHFPIDMVADVPLDPMHLLDLGVMRKLLQAWIKGERCERKYKLSVPKVDAINKRLLMCKTGLTVRTDFGRQVRGIKELAYWKATEFRTFRMHLGPIVLRNILSDQEYSNFLNFHVATRILSIKELCQNPEINDFCKSLLVRFVKTLIRTFGTQFISYNVHGLIHLPDDALRFGPIEKFPAYPFENYNGILKNLVRKGNKPLEQIVKRVIEMQLNQEAPTDVETFPSTLHPLVHYEHFDGPLPQDLFGRQYKQVEFRNWTFMCKTPNNIAILCDGTPIIIHNFVVSDSKTYVIGQAFVNTSPLFNSPIDSREIGTFKVNRLSGENQAWQMDAIKCKGIKLPLSSDGAYVISSLNEH